MLQEIQLATMNCCLCCCWERSRLGNFVFKVVTGKSSEICSSGMQIMYTAMTGFFSFLPSFVDLLPAGFKS